MQIDLDYGVEGLERNWLVVPVDDLPSYQNVAVWLLSCERYLPWKADPGSRNHSSYSLTCLANPLHYSTNRSTNTFGIGNVALEEADTLCAKMLYRLCTIFVVEVENS